MPDRDFLDGKHPIFTATCADIERDEIRFHGGPAVLTELRRFEQSDDAYLARQREALHLNHMHATAQAFVGHILREFPEPGEGLTLGGLGEVRREGRSQRPTPAELLWYNVDGAGSDGQQLPGFIAAALRRAMLGHRWIFVEASAEAPRTQADEQRGLRPYWVEMSPLDVPDWHYGPNGVLDYAIMTVADRNPRLVNGVMEGHAYEPGYYLHVRAGFQGFGTDYARGGWWRYDKDKVEIASGDYSSTDGQIPLVALYGEKSRGTRNRPAMSRSLLWGIGQADVALMNAMSARAFDAWDAAKSERYITGIDREGWDLYLDLKGKGSQDLPLINPKLDDGSLGRSPGMIDASIGTVAAGVFDSLIASLLTQVDKMTLNLATSAPESSGTSKRVGFAEGMSPRLASLAENLETALNSLLYFTERRWGIANPSAEIQLPRDFDLAPLVDDIDRMFMTLRDNDLRSPTLERDMAMAAARSRRVLTDANAKTVEDELLASAQGRAQDAANERTLLAAMDDVRRGTPDGVVGAVGGAADEVEVAA